MKENDFFTELKYTIKYPEDFGPTEITVRKKIWDMNLDQLFEVFVGIAGAAGYHSGSMEEVAANYLVERGYDVISPEELKENEDDKNNL